jgi:hypothetical protein
MAELLMVGTVPSLETAVLLFLQQDDPTKATESMGPGRSCRFPRFPF